MLCYAILLYYPTHLLTHTLIQIICHAPIDSPAGIRTMSLVSLGSCLFTINSAYAFINGPMNWDASRVSAAIPSGVGFLGAGLIFKKEEKNEDGDSSHVVHGLTTAASVWLSAAVGIACGGELYFAASFGVAIMMLLLRFGPRGSNEEDEEEDDDIEMEADVAAVRKAEEDGELLPMDLVVDSHRSYASISHAMDHDSERASLTRHGENRKSIRKRQANLGSLL
jgi:putative Mg2+ transporter-C (MgtC) family protein